MPVDIVPSDLPELVAAVLRSGEFAGVRVDIRGVERGSGDGYSLLYLRAVSVRNNRRDVSDFRDVLLGGGVPFEQYGVGPISRRVHVMATAEAYFGVEESAEVEGV